MFLVNSPPVAAFPSKWTPFGPKASSKIHLTKTETIRKIPKPRQLLGIVKDQQSDESSHSMSTEYERIMQKNKEGHLNYDRGLKANTVKGHPKEQSTFLAQLKTKKEESSKLSTPELDSDSDDSVDRDIEEAIQEYLKNKGTADSSLSPTATKNSRTSESNSNKQIPGSSNAAVRRSPVKMVTSTTTCNTFSPPYHSRCSSPETVDSDDSFEQSIKDEIEQFLNQKKLQNSANETGDARKVAQSTATAKPKQKTVKVTEKQGPKQVIKGLLDKPPSESLNLLPKSSKPKAESFKANSSPKTLSGSVRPKQPRKEASPKQYEELSESSSDDGIEEAIQLYQLEKNRLEGSHNVAQKPSPDRAAKIAATTAPNVSHCQEKNSSSPDSQKSTDNRKRKLPFSRPVASQDSSSCPLQTSKRASYFGDDGYAKCDSPMHMTRRAEMAAELMCAEAILDISKAILPSQPESAFVISQEMSPAQPTRPCAGDSSVDSDDSIEQEIRTFLARKAQTEGLVTAPAKPFSPDRPKQMSPSGNKTVFLQKGKLTESKNLQREVLGKSAELDKRLPAQELIAASAGSLPNERLQSKCSKISLEDRCKPLLKSEEASIVQAAAENLMLLPGLMGGKRKMYTKIRGNSSGDKSSSLDSDEDLDSAIKDLLRSKRKIKKRPKDGRMPCKKRVRFGETTNRPLESFCNDERLKDCFPKPAVVKSCLVNSTELQEEALKKSKANVKARDENVAGNSDLSLNKPECKPVSASEKPVKLSSALPEAPDSSSVDSDDSIEQEIRKFLAERARESAELSAMQKALPASDVAQTESLASFNTPPPPPPPPVKQEPRVLSVSETESILQKVMEKDRINAPASQPAVIQRVQECKDIKAQVRLVQRPSMEMAKASAPVHSVIVKRECFVEQNRVVRPAEKLLSAAPERVLVKPGAHVSQGSPSVSGNFVAGLKYISGTDQQILLNMGKASTTRVAAELYGPSASITKLGTVQPVQKKTLILEQPKIVQAPTFSLSAPVVRPALYVVTTKMVKDAPATLCLPINTATYDAGLNLMSIQYCQSQVAPHASVCATPFAFQPGRASELVMNIPGVAGEAMPLGTKERGSQSVTDIASRSCNALESSAKDVAAASGSSAMRRNLYRAVQQFLARLRVRSATYWDRGIGSRSTSRRASSNRRYQPPMTSVGKTWTMLLKPVPL